MHGARVQVLAFLSVVEERLQNAKLRVQRLKPEQLPMLEAIAGTGTGSIGQYVMVNRNVDRSSADEARTM